jgi:HSP20 family protein
VALRQLNGSPCNHQSQLHIKKRETTMRSLIHYTNLGSRLLPSFSLADRSSAVRFEGDFGRWFETALADLAAPVGGHHFPVDVYEDKDNTYVRGELPGVNREDIKVEMVDGFLTINASRKSLSVGGQGEESFSFSRSVNMPENMAADNVAAAYENGVLTVTLPKQEETRPKKITVAVK